jgi:uncharacterized membrane protein
VSKIIGYVPTGNTTTSAQSANEKPRFSLTKILYILGGSITLLGILFFVAQIWDDIGAFGRITVTLIFGLIMALIGSMFLKTRPESHLGQVFHTIGGLLIPGGALVTLEELSTGVDQIWPVTAIFGVIFLFYLLLNLYHKSVILTVFAVANGTAFIYLLVEAIIDGPFYLHDNVYEYLTMVVGLCTFV